MNDHGWRPMRRPAPRKQGAEGFLVTPFVRMARVHAASAAADGAITAALAGSIFFSISPDESRGRVALALLLTMAPFAVVTPLIGPAIDRAKGGRRVMILVTLIGRAIVAFLMIRHFDTFLLFPEAFGILVLQKGYSVSKSAVVPQFVQNDQDFVRANSRLTLISSIAGPLGAGLAGLFSLVGGPAVAAAIAMIGFIVAAILAFQLPPIVVADHPAEAAEKAELRDARIMLASTSMMMIRGIVGFVTMLLMFELRGGKDGINVSADGAAFGAATATIRGHTDWVGDLRSPLWHFALVALFAVAGSLSGAQLAPILRARVIEERMLAGALGFIVAIALFAGLNDQISATALLAFAISFSTVTGKLAFDALVMRDAPDANYGRTFARFEARFQGSFAVGAFVPVAVRMGVQTGAWIVAIAATVALVSYVLGGPGRGGFSRRPNRPADDAASAGAAIETDEIDQTVETDETIEFGVDDIRPSQPAPPAVAGEWSAPETWDDTTPYVSSIDGVEVDPAPPPPPTSDDRDGDEPSTDPTRMG